MLNKTSRVLVAALALATLSAAGCAGLGSGLPPTAHAPRQPLEARYLCGDGSVELSPGASGRKLYAANQDATTAGYRDDEGDHFVFFYWADDAGRVAIEYVVPVDGETPAEVRTYDRAAGARFNVDVLDDGAWTVHGKPSAKVSCQTAPTGTTIGAVAASR